MSPTTCQMCEADTGRHQSGTVSRREKCGCDVAGIGLLPNPWHIHQCPLHAAAPRLRDVLVAIITASDGCQGHRHCNHSLAPWQDARALLAELED